MTARDLTADDFVIITDADMAMLDFVANARAEDVDYSAFYIDEQP